jgi:hypothetical protein
MIGPTWLRGHDYAVLLDGEFSACFSTASYAELTAVQRAMCHADGTLRRTPLAYVVVDRRYGTVVASGREHWAVRGV